MSAAVLRAPLTGARLSELARCPRMCALGAIGTARAEPTEQQQRYMSRGNFYGAYVAEQFRAKYGRENVERERVIPWACGEGHADVYVRTNRLLVEVVSTVAPYSIVPDKILQAKLYLAHDAEADKAAVYVVNPSDLSREDELPVRMTDDDHERIGHLVAGVERAVETRGEQLPECVCATPTACKFKGCPFTEIAWDGWQAPEPDDLDEAARLLVLQLHAMDRVVRESEQAAKDRAAERETIRAELRALLEPGREYIAGPVRVKRVEVRGRETFSYKLARDAGLLNEDALAPFVKVGQPSERWYLRRDGDEPIEPDFGEAPF